jgi:hypothetical protein
MPPVEAACGHPGRARLEPHLNLIFLVSPAIVAAAKSSSSEIKHAIMPAFKYLLASVHGVENRVQV